MKTKIASNNKRLVAVAFNLDGNIDAKTLSSLRQKGLKDSDSTQTIIFDDASGVGQAAFIFEIYDRKDTSFVQRVRHFFRKGFAAATAYVRNGVFVSVVVKGERSVFPVHGA